MIGGIMAEITETERRKLWERSDQSAEKFLALLNEQHHGGTRLARQVNLLVHIQRRAAELDWNWTKVHTACQVNRETLRKLRLRAFTLQTSSKKAIEDGLGWAPGSVDACLTGATPELLVAGPATPPQDAGRSAFSGLGLTPDDLAVMLARYDAGDPSTRRLAHALHLTVTEDIDPAIRSLLLSAAVGRISRTLADERISAEEILTALNTKRS